MSFCKVFSINVREREKKLITLLWYFVPYLIVRHYEKSYGENFKMSYGL